MQVPEISLKSAMQVVLMLEVVAAAAASPSVP